MAKNKKTSKKRKISHSNISQLHDTRNGGQIALRGYTYQYLYSCCLILSSSQDLLFHLEGIEDIDRISLENDNTLTTHIQVKYSTIRKDASFMDDVLENFLEAYLIDKNRMFKLVYDFDVAKGNLSKLFSSKLDKSSILFWKAKIDTIKDKNSFWNWDNYNFEDFISKLSFEYIKKDDLAMKIETSLIKNFNITIDNIALYANSIKLLCLDRMEKRQSVNYNDIVHCIESVAFDISKGVTNPAHAWIQKIDFSKTDKYKSSYYEGKKAIASDIANELPIIRSEIEKDIINSIEENTVTIIKASSGQGKTTLALRASYLLQKKYKPYQLICCNNDTEIKHIVEYFRLRTRLGECPLILLDNLDSHLGEWSMLAQLMQSSVTYHYKLLITTRESDWYNYAGDISNIQSINIIKPVLTKKEAENIFIKLQHNGMLHSSITEWKPLWNTISDKQLLIEYVYLLTHGEMLAERISSQMKEIANSSTGRVKSEILRKVCFADMCGIKISIDKLSTTLSSYDGDVGELVKSLSQEFLLQVDESQNYIEGMHPIRSKHIVERLHEFYSLNETILSVSKLAEKKDIPVLFSHYPEFSFNKKEFYCKISQLWCSFDDLSKLELALKGLFSGTVHQYFIENKEIFDEAYNRGGLYILATDICPFANFDEIEERSNLLEKLNEITPNNANIKRLIELRDSMSMYSTKETDVFFLCNEIYNNLSVVGSSEITDIESYASLVYWLLNMHESMNITYNLSLENLWNRSDNISLEALASLMYSSFIGNKENYLRFVENNISRILHYLKQSTNSHLIYTSDKNRKIHIEYILKSSDINKGNEQSVNRLKNICRMLPIYDTYCADAISPQLDILKAFALPNDAHKEMPLRNLVIMFHQTFTKLWLNTIQSNYEFDTVADWIEFWFAVRRQACEVLSASTVCMYKLLEGKKLGNSGNIFDEKNIKYNNMMMAHLLYPREHRPFEEPACVPQGLLKIKSSYFNGIQNYSNQFIDLLRREEKGIRLAIFNLRSSIANLLEVENYFKKVLIDKNLLNTHNSLCIEEKQRLQEAFMCCLYYSDHLPNPAFQKYQVKAWYGQRKKNLLDEVTMSISGLKNEYDVIFPNMTYEDNIFVCYPIILKEFDIANEEGIEKLFLSMVEISNTFIDYLLLLCLDENEMIQPQAIKVPKRFFENIDKPILEESESLSLQLTPPYPVAVTQKMLDCFSGYYQIQNPTINEGLDLLADIAEQLWVYSKTKELLTKETDGKYYEKSIFDIKTTIETMLKKARLEVELNLYSEIEGFYSGINKGEHFKDLEYNKYLTKILSFN